jgi:hypothetical protein
MGVYIIRAQMKRASPAGQVATVGNLEAGQQGDLTIQYFSLQEEPRQVKRPGGMRSL